MEDYASLTSAIVLGVIAILNYFNKRKIAGHVQDIYLNYKAITKADVKDDKAKAVEALFNTLVDKTGVKKTIDKAISKGKTKFLSRWVK